MATNNHALLGYSGYVGSTLRGQTTFEHVYNSSNINTIDGMSFDNVVCAAAPAQKWIANREPGEDKRKIEGLIAHLATIKCNYFILISTVDVFKDSLGVVESSVVDEEGLHPYGLHRRMLEKFVGNHFEKHLIVRLPGLVGPGLRKNIIFDFLNDNNLNAIDSRGIFQFYPMINLWYDLQIALNENLQLLHLTAEPLGVAEVSELGFGKTFSQEFDQPAAKYDMQSQHAELFGGQGKYQYSRRDSIQAIRAYAQSEPRTLKTEAAS